VNYSQNEQDIGNQTTYAVAPVSNDEGGWKSHAISHAERILDQCHNSEDEGSDYPHADQSKVSFPDKEEAKHLNQVLVSVLGGGGRSPEALWSKGSVLHIQGKCKACHYIHSTRGCSNGEECKFCHIPHSSSNRSKVSASKRTRSKQIADMLALRLQEEPDTFNRLCELVGQRSDFLMDTLHGGGPPEAGRKVILSL